MTMILGDCTIMHEGDRLRVTQADPKVWVARELLAELDAGNLHPDITFVDDVLTINGVNRRVIYRVRRDVEWLAGACVLAEWPD